MTREQAAQAWELASHLAVQRWSKVARHSFGKGRRSVRASAWRHLARAGIALELVCVELRLRLRIAGAR